MENKFLTKFDSVKSKFINNLKDDIFKQEIETFTKYNIIDENNMFNYIYMHNYYKKLLDDPFVYKINIISNNNEQIKSLLSLLFKEPIENLNLNKQSIYQTYINFNDKSQKNLFDSYIIKDNEKKLLIENKPIKEIFDHINVEENSEILITPNDFKFNIYPSIIFRKFKII